MARPPHPGPTERELTLLKILWRFGPSTIKQILAAFPHTPKPAHTSIQTNLQGMLDKGYVTRYPGQPSHLYAAAISQEEVEQHAVKDLIGRVFDGSALRLMTTAITQGQASPEEIERLQALLDERAKRE
ncbi:BlaI/MecI/CopY family transcriptional regulator [Deinococcus planocerae]|uniref:BlaI/MecI/CopY family transcriptional regulator n=1 Tax=Deinococcus planocerae TaxID=1737569 RepID=UPI000C7F10A8|nr:BlaI/MecI/CopY family transcriptional regulator [Deinococcus planocerae]